MIHLENEYYINADKYGYAVVRQTDYLRQKTGEYDVDVIGYYGTLEQALKGYLTYCMRMKVANERMECRDLIGVVQDLKAHVTELFKDLNV